MTTSALPFSRRALLGHAGATVAVGMVPAMASAAVSSPAAEQRFAALLGDFSDEILVLAPEQATNLGVDVGAHAALKSQLSDVSAKGIAAWGAGLRSMQGRLASVDRAALSPASQVRRDTLAASIERGLAGSQFFYATPAAGIYGGTAPYIVSQQDGAVTSIPEFLNSQHKIASVEDCEAYLARIGEFARTLDQETEVIRQNAARGVVPPGFIAANALGQLKGYRAVAPADQPLVASLATRARAANLAGDWAGRAAQLLADKVYPALDREIAAFAQTTTGSSDVAGVGQRLPQGEAYYHWALGLGTTTTQTAQDIHKIGLEQNSALLAQMDVLLKGQGLTQGSIGARLQALNTDKRFLYPDTDAGRADLLAYLNDRVAAIRPMLPRLSHMPLKADLRIKRVPVDIQDGAALGYMNFASLDGSRPAIYYVNLKSTSLWPKYQLSTLTAHEGIPGHAWQGAYLAEHHAEIPLMTSILGFNAFVEGWALYAEQLVDEMGLYADDPFGRIGYLQAQQFRACRLVVDTGLHAMGWTREQAITFLTEQTGKGVGAMTSEVDRYCASPGQACGYKIGHNEILRLRARAQRLLGAKFDLAAYNDVVVQTGGVPLTILAQVVDRYIAGRQA
jgi:uncharacterized protein (DUF885 family)